MLKKSMPWIWLLFRAFAISSAEQAGKIISILVNVVGGLIARKRMEEMDDAFWDQVMTLNTKSIFAMTQAFASVDDRTVAQL